MVLDEDGVGKMGEGRDPEAQDLPISFIWGAFLREEYDEDELAKSWQAVLSERKSAFQAEGVLTDGSPMQVADVAIGTGFGVLKIIDLLRKSHPGEFVWWCNDGSRDMIEACRREAQKTHLDLDLEVRTWQELGDDPALQNRFHFVLCRGSSINYVLGWEEGGGPEEQSRWTEAVLASAKSFFQIVAPGGEVYVDVTSQEQLDTECDEYECTVDIEGVRYQLHEVVIRKEAPPERALEAGIGGVRKFMREWISQVTRDGVQYPPSTRKSLHLPHEELIEIFELVGFQRVQRDSVAGEQYTGFFFRKPN